MGFVDYERKEGRNQLLCFCCVGSASSPRGVGDFVGRWTLWGLRHINRASPTEQGFFWISLKMNSATRERVKLNAETLNETYSLVTNVTKKTVTRIPGSIKT